MDTTDLTNRLRRGIWVQHQEYGRTERVGDQRSSAPNEAADAIAMLERQIVDMHAAYGHSQQQFLCATQEVERLRGFAQAVMSEWPQGGVDGDDLQSFAHDHGLLEPLTRTTPCRDEGCACADSVDGDEWAAGVTCFRKTALLLGA